MPNDLQRIVDELPQGFVAEQILYVRVTMEATADKHLKIRYKMPPPIPGNDIQKAVRSFLGMPFLSGLVTRSPLDLKVDKRSWIIFHLSDDWVWHFSATAPGFTVKDKANAGRYRHLLHATPSDIASVKPQPYCKMIYFAAPEVTARYADGYNLHIDFPWEEQDPYDGVWLSQPVIFDPDIKNPGGPPPFL